MIVEDEFSEKWSKFQFEFRAKLLQKSKTQPVTLAGANMVLKEAIYKWEDSYDICGSWVKKLRVSNSKKADAVLSVIKSMRFNNEIRRKEMPDAVLYGVPIAASILTGGVTVAFHIGLIKEIVAFVAPSAILYPSLRHFKDSHEKEGLNALVNRYDEQLEIYRQNINDILFAE
jgi:hypothetical protein